MRCFITGVAGFLGSHLADGALARGWTVLGVDNFFRGKREHLPAHDQFTFMELDLCDENTHLSSHLSSFAPDLILHYGAINGTEYFYEQPWGVFETNVRATSNLLKALSISGHTPQRVAYASSSEVYGEIPDIIPTAEDGITRLDIHSTRDSYASSKAIGDFYVKLFCEDHSIPWTILRIFNAYGTRMDASKYGQVIPEFIRKALDDTPFAIIGDGSQTRSFCHVDDHVRMVLDAVTHPDGIGVVNIGNDEEITIEQLAHVVLEAVNRPFEVENLPLRANDPPRRAPDCSRIKSISGPCRVSLEEGIARCVEHELMQDE